MASTHATRYKDEHASVKIPQLKHVLVSFEKINGSKKTAGEFQMNILQIMEIIVTYLKMQFIQNNKYALTCIQLFYIY